jgi:hypothetical protein
MVLPADNISKLWTAEGVSGVRSKANRAGVGTIAITGRAVSVTQMLL